jgi:hypothetical protein
MNGVLGRQPNGMNDDDKRYLTIVFTIITESMGHAVKVDNSDNYAQFMVWHGLGLIDALSLRYPEFYKMRTAYQDLDDNDIKSFLTSAKCLYDWLVSLEIIAPTNGAPTV